MVPQKFTLRFLQDSQRSSQNTEVSTNIVTKVSAMVSNEGLSEILDAQRPLKTPLSNGFMIHHLGLTIGSPQNVHRDLCKSFHRGIYKGRPTEIFTKGFKKKLLCNLSRKVSAKVLPEFCNTEVSTDIVSKVSTYQKSWKFEDLLRLHLK